MVRNGHARERQVTVGSGTFTVRAPRVNDQRVVDGARQKFTSEILPPYTGSAGKVTNCQIGVSLSLTTRTEHPPVNFELYLPESWTEDPARRREARVPDTVLFQTKPQLGLAMIRRAVEDGLPRGVVLADTAYGSSSEFRQQLRDLGLDYAVAVDPQTAVWLLDGQSRCRATP